MVTARTRKRTPTRGPLARLSLALLAAIVLAPNLAIAEDILFVVRRFPLGEGDDIIDLQLRLRGFNVTAIDDDVVTTGDATGMDLVLVSATVSSTKVGSKFASVAVPVVTAEGFILDDMGMTGTTSGVDFGFSIDQSQLDIVGTSPLTAGLSGTISMAVSGEQTQWGVPGVNAIVGAYEAGSTTRAGVFGYEIGATMPGGVAPARRVGLYMGANLADAWTADGIALFEHAVAWALGDPPPSIARVMFIGDSITAGIQGRTTWRVPLWDLLAADNCDVDFVGSFLGVDPVMENYDAHHESVQGFRTDEIEAQLPANLVGNVPDYAAIHLGTNDVLQGTSLTAAKENLRDIIDILRLANPSVEITLAKIIPNKPLNDADTVTFNGYVGDLAVEEDLPGSPITVVDHYTRYDPLALNGTDQIHPNDDGNIEMANRWFAGIHPQLASFCGGASEEPPPPAPPPVPSISGLGLAVTALLLGVTGMRSGRRRRA